MNHPGTVSAPPVAPGSEAAGSLVPPSCDPAANLLDAATHLNLLTDAVVAETESLVAQNRGYRNTIAEALGLLNQGELKKARDVLRSANT